MNPYVADVWITFIQLLTWTLIVRALLSWLPIDQSTPAYQALLRVTEPIIQPVRRIMPSTGMMDLSPLFTILGLLIIGQIFRQLAAIE